MFLPTSIQIGSLVLNNCDHASAVSFGMNEKLGRSVNAKKNQGFGQQFADRTWRLAAIQLLLEDDGLDSYSQKIDNR